MNSEYNDKIKAWRCPHCNHLLAKSNDDRRVCTWCRHVWEMIGGYPCEVMPVEQPKTDNYRKKDLDKLAGRYMSNWKIGGIGITNNAKDNTN